MGASSNKVPAVIPGSVLDRVDVLRPHLEGDLAVAWAAPLKYATIMKYAATLGLLGFEEANNKASPWFVLEPTSDDLPSPEELLIDRHSRPLRRAEPASAVKTRSKKTIVFVLSPLLVDALDRLARTVNESEAFSARGRCTRSAALRIAVAAGIRSLEARYLPVGEWSGPFADWELIPKWADAD